MYTFKFYVTADDVDMHVKNSLNEESREKFKDARFVPLEVSVDGDRNIEITAVAVVDNIGEEESAKEAEQ
jgi:hypothetical protein